MTAIKRTTDARTDLSAMTTAEMKAELHKAIGITAQAIARVALLWTELTRRNEDLSDVPFALAAYMADVASGRLLPEAVAALAGRVRTLKIVSDLPIDEQRSIIIDQRAIPILAADGEVRKKRLDDLTFAETARVIADGRVRSIDEQRLVLGRAETAAAARRNRPRRGPRPRITVDPDNVVHIGLLRVPAEDVIAALRTAGLIAD